MGTLQHHLPAFISQAWHCPEALTLALSRCPTEEARAAFLRGQQRAGGSGGQSREKVILVAEKSSERVTIVARPARSVGASTHLYSLPSFNDPRKDGIAASMLSSLFDIRVPPPRDDADLLDWADRAGAESPHRTFVEDRITALIDSPAFEAVRRVRSSRRINIEDVQPLFAFLRFATFRSPCWIAHNRAGLSARALQIFNGITLPSGSFENNGSVGAFLRAYEDVAALLGFHSLLAGMLRSSRLTFASHTYFRLVLFDCSESAAKFVHSDNAARPLNLKRAHRASTAAPMPMQGPGAWVVYPISPTLALGLTITGGNLHRRTVRVSADLVQRLNTGFAELASREVILPGSTDGLFRPPWQLSRSRPFVEVGASGFSG